MADFAERPDLTPCFPLVFLDVDETFIRLETIDDVRTEIEDLSERAEYGPDDELYDCRDAEGHRVRLIVDLLEVAICHRIPSDFQLRDLVVKSYVNQAGLAILRESIDGTAVRALKYSPENAPLALPERWNLRVEVEAADCQEGQFDGAEFHTLWMDAWRNR